jgi:hypothetical protein
MAEDTPAFIQQDALDRAKRSQNEFKTNYENWKIALTELPDHTDMRDHISTDFNPKNEVLFYGYIDLAFGDFTEELVFYLFFSDGHGSLQYNANSSQKRSAGVQASSPLAGLGVDAGGTWNEIYKVMSDLLVKKYASIPKAPDVFLVKDD